MEKSTSDELSLRTVPRWALLIPLLGSLVGMQQQFWGWNWCRAGDERCFELVSGLSWSVALFPHVLAFPLAMVVSRAWQALAVLLAIDVGIVLLIWKTQPPRLSLRRVAILLSGWTALSVAATFSGPELMVWAYRLAH